MLVRVELPSWRKQWWCRKLVALLLFRRGALLCFRQGVGVLAALVRGLLPRAVIVPDFVETVSPDADASAWGTNDHASAWDTNHHPEQFILTGPVASLC